MRKEKLLEKKRGADQKPYMVPQKHDDGRGYERFLNFPAQKNLRNDGESRRVSEK